MILDKIRRFFNKENEKTVEQKEEINKWVEEYNKRLKEKISLKRLEDFYRILNDYLVLKDQHEIPYFVFKDFLYLIEDMTTEHAIQAVHHMERFCKWNNLQVPREIYQIRQVKEMKIQEKMKKIEEMFK